MSAQPSPFAEALSGLGSSTDSIRCRVCDVEIDSTTGEALSPVTPDNVAAVRQYMTAAGAAEEGGIPLL